MLDGDVTTQLRRGNLLVQNDSAHNVCYFSLCVVLKEYSKTSAGIT